ncbi:hypothetical protein Nm8I071_36490 [Nonomuraea sp. TT08I-71]|nr:hypothetical protein Nm8I071_36490 [Nonomuraea sp. TT08I-71]
MAVEPTDRTLRSNFRALAVAAGLKYTKIRSIEPAIVEGAPERGERRLTSTRGQPGQSA